MKPHAVIPGLTRNPATFSPRRIVLSGSQPAFAGMTSNVTFMMLLLAWGAGNSNGQASGGECVLTPLTPRILPA